MSFMDISSVVRIQCLVSTLHFSAACMTNVHLQLALYPPEIGTWIEHV